MDSGVVFGCVRDGPMSSNTAHSCSMMIGFNRDSVRLRFGMRIGAVGAYLSKNEWGVLHKYPHIHRDRLGHDVLVLLDYQVPLHIHFGEYRISLTVSLCKIFESSGV